MGRGWRGAIIYIYIYKYIYIYIYIYICRVASLYDIINKMVTLETTLAQVAV